MNDTDTALFTQTASPSLAWTLTSINNNNSSLFSQVFPQCDSLVSTTHTARAGAAREKKDRRIKNGGGAVAIAAGN